MVRSKLCSRAFLLAFCAGTLALTAAARGEPPESDSRPRLREPVYRVSNKLDSPKPREEMPPAAPPAQAALAAAPAAAPMPAPPMPEPEVAAQHPLDQAIAMAREGLAQIRDNVRDYTCTLVKRERVNGTLNEYEYMFAKIRNRKLVNGEVKVPFSVYLNFLKPASIKGREVVYVEGANNDKMMAHEGGSIGAWLPSVWLRPDSRLAMRGNLYPLTDVGIENLVVKLIERGEREKQYGQCEVTFHKNAKVNGRVCTLLQIMHPEKSDQFEFYLAQIFIDDEYNVPIRYAAYAWPSEPGGRPEVIEEYTYLNLKLNVGLTDEDFDPNNSNYNFTRN